MKRWKKYLVILMIVLICPSISGCWNYQEVENMAIVIGVAVDKGQNGAKYHLTLECLNLSQGKGNDGNNEGSSYKTALLESDGDTFFDAVRNVLHSTADKAYFSDCKMIIFSSQIAQDGIEPLLDFIMRDAEPRITMPIIISRQDTAAAILGRDIFAPDGAASKLADVYSRSVNSIGNVPNVKTYQIMNTLQSQGVSLVLPGVSVMDGTSGKVPYVSQCALFKQDKMVAWLSEDLSKAYMISSGKVGSGIIVTGTTEGAKNISLEILNGTSKIQPEVSGDSVSAKIDVTLRVAMGEENDSSETVYQQGTDMIQQVAEKEVKERIEDMIRTTQQYDCDILGIGSDIYLNHPKEWETLKDRWDAVYSNLPVEVSVKVSVENTAVERVKGG